MAPKAQRATPQQYAELIDLIAKRDELRYGKGSPDVKKGAWEGIAEKLNAMGGAHKTAEGWKKAFIEWKSHVKKKYRNKEPLSATEEKCAEVMGIKVTVLGLPNVLELGAPHGESLQQAEPVAETNLEVGTNPEAETNPETDTNPKAETNPVAEENPKSQPQVNINDTEDYEVITVEVEPMAENSSAKSGRKPKTTKSSSLKRTTYAQYEMYIEYKRSCQDNDILFKQVCEKLNEEKNAPIRTPKEWQRIFNKWESKVKAKARRIHYEQEITGGGIPIIEILTELELKLLKVLSKILIYGLPGIVELGFQNKKTEIRSKTNLKRRKIRKSLPKLKPVKNNRLLKESFKMITQGMDELKKSLLNLYKALRN